MTTFYGYIRVSTAKQEKGVSLEVQRAAIRHFAERQGLQVIEWFEEVLTAAKNGRPLFVKMIKGLKSGRADGVIMHKIDRSARNLRDWLELGDLIDSGQTIVHFVNESIDLRSRGGRLSADIQAVIAADYIRNLREETLKGMRGRLKQGLLPFCAPIGYLNTGKGNPKTIDPLSGPLIRQAFELYATGRYTLRSLLVELHRRGLRNRHGRAVCINDLSRVLNNPFYTGLIRIRTTGETYQGIHAPLIKMTLFKQVQARLTRRLWTRGWVHDFTLRGLFQCSLCKRNLIGELQKGHIYYRCQTSGCPTRTFREEVLEAAMLTAWLPLALSPDKRQQLLAALEYVLRHEGQDENDRSAQLQLQIGATKSRLTRLIDAFVDGAIDKESFEERKRTLLEEQRSLEGSLRLDVPDPELAKALIAEVLELASDARQSYLLGNAASRRELAIRLCSNRSVADKSASVEPFFPLLRLASRDPVLNCAPHQYETRTLHDVARDLLKWAKDQIRREDGLDSSNDLPRAA